MISIEPVETLVARLEAECALILADYRYFMAQESNLMFEGTPMGPFPSEAGIVKPTYGPREVLG